MRVATAETEIRELLAKINDAWLNRRTAELNDYFHDDIVIRGPGFQEMGRGKGACVKSYEDFMRQATLSEFKTSEPEIDLWANGAAATYSWQMVYQMGGKEHREMGHDLFVFTCEGGWWLAVWRAITYSPQA